MTCQICGSKLSIKNDFIFRKQFFSEDEIRKLPVKEICLTCKRDLFFAGLISVV